jgi:hypothetical protein
MYKPLYACIIACFCVLFSPSLQAQNDVIKLQNCEGNPFQHAVDSIKKASADQGYVLLRETSIQMESEYEMPVVLPMQAGTQYQFVFIGDPSSKLYEVRMFDFNERQVVYKRHQWGDVDGSIISYTYVPQFSEYHMIKPVQVNKKKKNLCGYVMLLKKPEPTAKN